MRRMRHMGPMVTAMATFALACLTCSALAKPSVVISWSWTTPDTAYARKYIEWLETRPFDGIAMTIDPRDAEWLDDAYWQNLSGGAWLKDMCAGPRENGSLSWGGGGGMTAFPDTCPWNPKSKYTDATMAKALADLKATRFNRFRFNLIESFVVGGTNDWFNDEEWAQRCRNYAVLARFARQAGLRGIFFDDEDYGGSAWPRPGRGGRSLEEMHAKARQRGREFAQAMCKEFPDMVFWVLHGYSSMAGLVEGGLPEYGRSTKMPFFDGMLEGSTKDFVFVDGGENSYGHNTREHFLWGRKLCKEEPIRIGLTKVPELHRKKVRCGFGIWPDYYGRLDPDNLENSYHSPARFQRAVNLALEIGDGYVWVYGEKSNWWLEGPDDRAPVEMKTGARLSRGLPLAYWKALEAARKSPGSDTSSRTPASALPQQGRNLCIDGKELPALLAKCEKVYELPTQGWTFKLDDFGLDSDDPATFNKPIATGKTWDKQG